IFRSLYIICFRFIINRSFCFLRLFCRSIFFFLFPFISRRFLFCGIFFLIGIHIRYQIFLFIRFLILRGIFFLFLRFFLRSFFLFFLFVLLILCIFCSFINNITKSFQEVSTFHLIQYIINSTILSDVVYSH